jgi:3-methyladenine DNA glycosylase AlkD
MDHGLGGLDGFARMICENPSDQPNPWSIHLATQIQDDTEYLGQVPSASASSGYDHGLSAGRAAFQRRGHHEVIGETTMPPSKKSSSAKPARKKGQTVSSERVRKTASAGANTKPAKGAPASLEDQVQAVLKSLERLADKRVREDMSKRYGVYTNKAFGVSMSNIQKVARPLGRNHELAAALWETGWYEARMATSFIDEPSRVTTAQMDRWCRDFDNWGIVDTLCFNLFDRTPHAWSKVAKWSNQEAEFVKRAAFALLWSLTVHDKQASDEQFVEGLELIERAADDERHFVKKAVNMALRAVGKRNAALNAAAVKVARRLADSPNASARWVGKDALRELTSAGVTRRLAARG